MRAKTNSYDSISGTRLFPPLNSHHDECVFCLSIYWFLFDFVILIWFTMESVCLILSFSRHTKIEFINLLPLKLFSPICSMLRSIQMCWHFVDFLKFHLYYYALFEHLLILMPLFCILVFFRTLCSLHENIHLKLSDIFVIQLFLFSHTYVMIGTIMCLLFHYIFCFISTANRMNLHEYGNYAFVYNKIAYENE